MSKAETYCMPEEIMVIFDHITDEQHFKRKRYTENNDVEEEFLQEAGILRKLIQTSAIRFVWNSFDGEVIAKINNEAVAIISQHHLMDDILHQMIIALNKKCSK